MPKILIIDDVQDNVTSLRAVLSDVLPGCYILSALDGPGGIEIARREDPDVILLDIVMPVMDGFEVCRTLKALASTMDVPIIFLTALATDRDARVRALEAGAEGFLTKPPDEQELVARIKVLAKIKISNRQQRLERNGLAELLSERTHHLEEELSERIRAETALRESEEKFSKSFKTSPYAITITRAADGRLFEVNDAFTTLTGYSREEAMASSSISLNLWMNLDQRDRVVADLRAGKTVVGEEHLFRTRSGRTITCLFSAQVMRVGEDNLILSSINDITDRKLAEEESQTAAQRLDITLSSLVAGVLSVSEDGKVELVNQAFCHLFHLTEPPSRYIGITSSEMLRAIADRYADPARTIARIQAVMAQGKPVSGEEVAMQDGRTLLVDYIPVSVDGNPVGRIWHHQDITAHKESEETYKMLFDSIRDAVHVFELNENGSSGRFVRVNEIACRRLGYTAKEFLTLSPRDIFSEKSRPLIPDIIAKIRQLGHQLFETEHVTKDGRVIPVEISSSAIQLKGKTIIHSIVRDLSERNEAAAARQALEEQLRASQKLEAIGGLAGGVAHDFNNLLSVILSYTTFAIDALPEGHASREDLLQVKKAGEAAAALTRQLLAFSRKQVLQPVRLSLNQVSAGVEKMLRRILGEDIEFLQVLAPDLGLVRADPGQIEQVLMNLVVNARDAMPGGGKLTIETSNVELDEDFAGRHVAVVPGSYIQLSVSDTGCGMDPKTVERVFEPFFTTKEMGKGTGLGLSTVYGIVRQSGGDVWVYSEPGIGTTFKIFLPRDISAAPAMNAASSLHQRCLTGTETILVVEDEEALRKVAKRALSAAGYNVLSASDGPTALRVSSEYSGEIHLLVTDVVMPHMGGRVLAREFLLTRPSVKVLYMSGYTDNAIEQHGEIEPGTHFLAKPFVATRLTSKVREVLDSDVEPRQDPP